MRRSMAFCAAWILVSSLALLAACGGGSPLPQLPGEGLTDLGTLGGESSVAGGVSADGRVVVGTSPVIRRIGNAYRWAGGAMTDLGTPDSVSSASGVSSDGAVVVGTDTKSRHAFRWTQASGMVDLGSLGDSTSQAYGVSGNGAVVVGTSGAFPDPRNPSGNLYGHAFRWTESGGMIDLGAAGGLGSSATAVSGDGAVVVGITNNVTGSQAFRWTDIGGMVNLGTLGGPYSAAFGVSGDGSVVVGEANVTDGTLHAFRWTASDGMVDLGTFSDPAWADFTIATASGVSADGRVVVGTARTVAGQLQAFRWTQATGMLPIRDWLRDYGITVPDGITFLDASATNQDGSIVAGQLGSNGHAYVARVVPVNRDFANRMGCLACHETNVKKIGPAFQDIATRYAGQPNANTLLTQKVLEGGADAWGMAPMPAFKTAGIKESDVRKLVAWILSQR